MKSAFVKKEKICLLLAVCCLLPFLLCACAGGGKEQEHLTPEPAVTVRPGLKDAASRVLEQVLACSENAEALNFRVRSALGQVTALSVPGQITRSIVQAVTPEEPMALENGWYSFSRSTGGRYSFDKPWAAVMSEGRMDSYVISDEGEPRETQETVFYDPYTYVMSGEGGGDFAFASYYRIREDGRCAETETVSRLNDTVSGWARDVYLYENGVLWFADAQLNPRVDTGEEGEVARWSWRICVGYVSAREANVVEFDTEETPDLSLPAQFPDLIGGGTASVSALMNRPKPVSGLSVKDGRVTLTGEGGNRSAQLK